MKTVRTLRQFSKEGMPNPHEKSLGKGLKSVSIIALLAVCVMGFAPTEAHAQWLKTFDEDIVARQLGPGCKPEPKVDVLESGRILRQITSRDQITRREKVPEAIWPHPDVPKPRWPAFNRAPHGLDLTVATGESSDKIGNAYFDHLCDTEAGQHHFRVVQEAPPVSVINLRPRKDRQVYDALMYDRYYLQAPASYRGYIGYFHERFVGDKPFRGPRIEGVDTMMANKALFDEIYEREYDPQRKWTTYWIRTDPPRQLTDWSALEPAPGALSFVERPVVANDPFEKNVSGDPRRFESWIGNNQMLRFSYAPLGEARTVTLASGREIQIYKNLPTPQQCIAIDRNDRVATNDCEKTYGSQHLIVTPTNESKAKYGYVWREFFLSEHDLRLGIRGTDWMVVDMKTGELVAHSRRLTRHVPVKPYLPPRTSVWIKSQIYECVGAKPGQRSVGIASAVGAFSAFSDLSNYPGLKPPIVAEPLPEPGDELITR